MRLWKYLVGVFPKPPFFVLLALRVTEKICPEIHPGVSYLACYLVYGMYNTILSCSFYRLALTSLTFRFEQSQRRLCYFCSLYYTRCIGTAVYCHTSIIFSGLNKASAVRLCFVFLVPFRRATSYSLAALRIVYQVPWYRYDIRLLYNFRAGASWISISVALHSLPT